jgi:hypothetical protein
MPSLVRNLRDRLVPSLLTAAGVTLLAAGLLHYGSAAEASQAGARPSPSDVGLLPQPNPRYPSCNVAMYYQDPRLGQPGEGRSIYLYAHARTGMFGPLYERVILRRNGGSKSLYGMLVDVYTSDDQRYVYVISGIRPNVKADSHFLDGPLAVKTETLWLQTSTGPNGSYPKLQVLAQPLAVVPADHATANPKAHPINCG